MLIIHIYCVTNLINNKKYVGQTRYDPLKRFNGHCADANNNNRKRRGLTAAIRKYGSDAFVVEKISSATSVSEAEELEAKYIKYFDTIKSGYNMLKSGACRREKGNPHVKTDKWKQKMSALRKEKWKDKECRKKMIEGRWGGYVSKSKYESPKLSKNEIAEIISESNKKRAKKFIFMNPNGDIYETIGLPDFCEEHGLDASCMSRVANCKQKQHKGWKCFSN